MQTSEQINELAAALSKAQGAIKGALKDSANPFFKSNYADLASVWDACREQLAANNLCVIQTVTAADTGVAVTTMLAHSSGQWIKDTLPLMPKDGSPQAVGSAITYGRRYALAAVAGVAQIDDDGNPASGRESIGNTGVPKGIKPQGDAAARVPTAEVTKWAKVIMDNGKDEGRLLDTWNEIKDDHDLATCVWNAIPKPMRDHIKALTTSNGVRQ
jgi:hypothetical protein